MKSLLRFLQWLRLIKLVWLRDFEGTAYLTVMRKDGFGLWAHVYPITGVGHVRLEENGTCSGSSYYIKEWNRDK